jgi:hypothetical protein
LDPRFERGGVLVVKVSLFPAFLLLSILLAEPLQGADSKSYGQPEELSGVTKIFVDAGGELDLHGVMAQTLAKRLPQVSIVPESSDAEIVLLFTYSRDSAKPDSFDGRLVAARISAGKTRYVASYRHDEAELDDLAEEIVLQFIKQYKQINGISK